MTLNLPLHPSKRHPLTGEPLRALFVDKHGRPRYPIMGGSEDGDADDSGGDDKPDDDDAGSGDTTDDKPTADKDLGFPKDTPVAEMKPVEQAAYYRHQARKHEDRNREWLEAAGGKTAAEIKAERAELATLRTEKMTDGEKAVENAKAEGRREASLALAPQMFDVALSHVDEDRRAVLIDSIDLSKVIKEDGTIDTAKVTTLANTLAPTGKDQGGGGQQYDLGGGRRSSTTSSGVAAGREMYVPSRKQKTT